MKFIRLFLLGLILAGLGLLATERLWVPSLVAYILRVDGESAINVPGTTTGTPTTTAADPHRATFIIEGVPVTLRDGKSDEKSIPNASAKIITTYFGNEATGDLNGDGKPDVVFLLTQTTGGSGTFYYVVAALSSPGGYVGTKAVLLGDRIAPQTTEIHDGTIVVNYAERKPDEPMTARPSLGVSMYLKISNGALLKTK